MNPDSIALLEKQVQDWDRSEGLNMIDLLEITDPLRRVLNWIVRQDQVTLKELSDYLELDIEKSNSLVEMMMSHKIIIKVIRDGETRFRAHIIIRGKRSPASKSILDEM